MNNIKNIFENYYIIYKINPKQSIEILVKISKILNKTKGNMLLDKKKKIKYLLISLKKIQNINIVIIIPKKEDQEKYIFF